MCECGCGCDNRGEQTSSRAVAFALGILLERIRRTDGSVAKKLAIHGINGSVGRFETCIIDESKSLKKNMNNNLDVEFNNRLKKRCQQLLSSASSIHLFKRKTLELPVSMSRMIFGG